MVKIKIKDLKFFPSMGVNLPCDSEVTTSLTAGQLAGTPLKGDDDVFIGSLSKWIVFYDGMTLPQGGVRMNKCANLMKALSVGYQIWLRWNVKM